MTLRTEINKLAASNPVDLVDQVEDIVGAVNKLAVVLATIKAETEFKIAELESKNAVKN